MIISGDFKTAKLDAIEMILQPDTKSVTIFFNKKEKKWCVISQVFSEEEWTEED